MDNAEPITGLGSLRFTDQGEQMRAAKRTQKYQWLANIAKIEAARKRKLDSELPQAVIVFADYRVTILAQVRKIDEATGQTRRSLRSKFNQKWREYCSPAALRTVAGWHK